MKVSKNCVVSLTVLVLLAAVTCVSAKNFVTSFDDDDYEFNGGPTEQLLAMAVPNPEELFRQDSKPLERNLDVEPTKNCSQYCPNDMYFRDTPLWATSQLNTTLLGKFCSGPSGMKTIYECYESFHITEPNMGWQYPGVLGCPNYCSNTTGQGQCVNDAYCVCAKGYSGVDCSQISCASQHCNYHGTCGYINGSAIAVCQCKPGYGLSDCSAKIDALPPYVQIVPDTQFSSWDKYGYNHPVFNDSTIATVHIVCNPADVQFFLNPANKETEEYAKADFYFFNGVVNASLTDVGFRIKGGISRTFVKKTWKVSFNEFVKGRKWYQLKKLIFKGASFDPSFQREKISADVLFAMNAKCERISLAQLYINGLYYGLQIMIENVDDQFLQSRFDNDEGELYKCNGTFGYLGTNPEDYYKNYEPETDAATNITNLANFLYILNYATPEEFPSQIENIFDVDTFVRNLAAEVSTGQFDGVWNANNYYLYYDYDYNKFFYFRHDLDISYGLWDVPSFKFGYKNIYNWTEYTIFGNTDKPHPSRGHLLVEKILAVDKFRDAYTQYTYELLQGYFKPHDQLSERIQALGKFIHVPAKPDWWHQCDYTWIYGDVFGNIDNEVARDIIYPKFPDFRAYTATLGLKQFVAMRWQVSASELQFSNGTRPYATN